MTSSSSLPRAETDRSAGRRAGSHPTDRVAAGPARWAVSITVVVLAAACTTSGTAITAPFSTSRPALERGPVYELKAAEVSGVGRVIVDGQGLTVYMFANDRRGSSSHCYDICAVQWPPLVLPAAVAAPMAGVGVRPQLLGRASRTDGTIQITYNGWPLYLWPPDRAPGQAIGQGLTNAGGRWYVLDPAGSPVIPP